MTLVALALIFIFQGSARALSYLLTYGIPFGLVFAIYLLLNKVLMRRVSDGYVVRQPLTWAWLSGTLAYLLVVVGYCSVLKEAVFFVNHWSV